MTIDQLRLEAAAQIRATHRRVGDAAAPSRVTISQGSDHYDLVRVEYADGVVREFNRCRPSDPQLSEFK